jgi:FixJ family two-component response regulator
MDTTLPWVAIVDDEEAIRRALLRLMRSADIAAKAFASGAELTEHLALLPAAAPCCVVLDLHMPGMGGLELQARLAELAPGAGVIVMTGHSTPEERARALQHQPLAYLLKPVNDQLLLDAIAAACPPSAP